MPDYYKWENSLDVNFLIKAHKKFSTGEMQIRDTKNWQEKLKQKESINDLDLSYKEVERYKYSLVTLTNVTKYFDASNF